MKKKKFSILLAAVLVVLSIFVSLTGCAQTTSSNTNSDTLNVVATTTMLADLTKIIGGDHVSVNGLMGAGIDPHLYQASAGDVTLMQNADIVVYNGLHLEGKMGDIFESLTNQGSAVICIGEGLDETKLLASEDNENVHDPHVWFDVSLWMNAAEIVSDGLCEADQNNAVDYNSNLAQYLTELEELDTYIKDRVSEIPEEQRVLVTAHDAFNYFGQAYDFKVMGLQGISTDSEAGTADVSNLATFIAENKIKAIFVESSIPTKTIEALQDAVEAKGYNVEIGGELYSDSLGDAQSNTESYIQTFKANIDTIIDALK